MGIDYKNAHKNLKERVNLLSALFFVPMMLWMFYTIGKTFGDLFGGIGDALFRGEFILVSFIIGLILWLVAEM